MPPPEMNMPQGPGYWALTRYADVMQVSRDPDTFHSAPSTTSPTSRPRSPSGSGSMINMDAPKHTKLRLIVNRGFTPRQIATLEESVRVQAREIVDRVAPMGECDFVAEIAAALPLQIICDMMGIPREDTKRIFELTNIILGVGDPEYVQTMEELMAAGMELFQYGLALADDRLANPRDDITSTLMAGEIEDENGRTGSRRASSGRSSCCSSSPATRRRATRSVTGCSRSPSIPISARSGKPTSKASPEPPSRRSCGGPRR